MTYTTTLGGNPVTLTTTPTTITHHVDGLEFAITQHPDGQDYSASGAGNDSGRLPTLDAVLAWAKAQAVPYTYGATVLPPACWAALRAAEDAIYDPHYIKYTDVTGPDDDGYIAALWANAWT